MCGNLNSLGKAFRDSEEELKHQYRRVHTLTSQNSVLHRRNVSLEDKQRVQSRTLSSLRSKAGNLETQAENYTKEIDRLYMVEYEIKMKLEETERHYKDLNLDLQK